MMIKILAKNNLVAKLKRVYHRDIEDLFVINGDLIQAASRKLKFSSNRKIVIL